MFTFSNALSSPQIGNDGPILVADSKDGTYNYSTNARDSIQINRFLLCSATDNREPVDSLQIEQISKSMISKVWAFADLAYYGEPRELTFKWFLNGSSYLAYDVEIAASENWRTYSYVSARIGQWKVQLTDGETVLKEIEFRVVN
jgi:hypothetical protein